MRSRARSSTPAVREHPAPRRAAVVGAGRIAEQHLAFLAGSPLAELVAVCDADPVLAAYMCDKFGGRPFTDLTETLQTTVPDVLHVLTPAALHVDMALEGLTSGAHVVVEKPMALDEAGREQLLESAATEQRLLVEDHNYRFNRPMVRLQDDLRSGAIGELLDVDVAVAMPLTGGNRYGDPNLPSASHSLPAGFIHEFITHLAYLTVAVVPTAELVEARWSRRLAGHGSRYDTFDAVIGGDGVTGRVRFTASAPRARIAVSAVGTLGTAEAEMIFGSYRVDRPRPGGAQLSPSVNAMVAGAGSAARGVGYVVDRLRGRTAYEGLHELLRQTYKALQEGTPPPVDGASMRRAGTLVDRLVESMP